MKNKLPEGWKIKKLIKCTPIIKTGVPEYAGEKPYYSTGSVDANCVTPEGMYTFKNKPSRANRIVKTKDVVQARMQGTRKALMINKHLDGSLFSTGFLHFRPEENNYNAKLFYYYLSSELFLKQRDEYASGSTQIALTDKGAKSIDLIIPPEIYQRKIADKLDSLLAKVKDAQSRLDKIPTILKRFRQSILASAFSGELTKDWREENRCSPVEELIRRGKFTINNDYSMFEIPKSWKWCALGNYANCSRGRFSVRPRNDPRYYNGKHPFIQIGDLPREGGYIKSHSQTLNDKGLGVSKMFPEGTVVIAIVGATIANTGILDYDMCFPDSMVGIETGDKICNRYLEYYLRSIKRDIRQKAYSSGGQPNIKLETLNPLPFCLAPKEEQSQIVSRLDHYFQTIDEIEVRYNNLKKYTDKLEQSILAKAFRGELVR